MKATRFGACVGTLLTTLAILGGCGGKGNPGVETDSSSGGSTGGNGGNTSSSVSEFALTHKFAVLSYLHDDAPTDWSKTCTVPATATTNATKYIDCTLETHEFDLYGRELELSISAPLSQCSYITIIPYWFWARKAGMGPTQILTQDDQRTTPSTPSIRGQTTAAGNLSDVGFSLDGANPVCDTDYTSQDGPNCCSGRYQRIHRVIAAGGAITDTTTKGTWGGATGNCAAGAGSEALWPRSKDEKIPGGIFKVADPSGLTVSHSFKIAIPSDNKDGTVLWRANFHPSTGPNSRVGSAYIHATLPYAAQAQPKYLFICYDAAHEAKARIALQIRKWNLVSELNKKSAGSWNDVGPDGMDPAYPENKNDFMGWETLTGLLDVNGYLQGVY